jgi:heat shock protein HslJ
MRLLIFLFTLLTSTGCALMDDRDDPRAIMGDWHIEKVGDSPVIDKSPASISFTESGTVAGNASCNRYSGQYTFINGVIRILPLATTRMMCSEALMEQEKRVLLMVEQIGAAEIENGMLILKGSEGEFLIRAAPVE